MWSDEQADLMALRRLIQRGIKELRMNVRNADYQHVIQSTITLVLCPPEIDLEPLKLRASKRAQHEIKRKR